VVADPYSPETVVRGFFAALNARDYKRAAASIDQGCEWWSMPADTMHRGPAAVVAGLDEFTASFPDWRADIDRLTAAGPVVAIEWISSGTFRAVFRGRLPNGKAFRRRGCSVAEVRNGLIVHYRDYFDRVSLLEQLDLMDLL
jgi:ketosteroid isomerase-like protein